MNRKINLIYIDEQDFFKEGLYNCLSQYQSFNIILASNDILKLPSFLYKNQIDILLVDLNVFLKNLEIFKQKILKHESEVKVVILSTLYEEDYVVDLISLNIHGILLREMNLFDFVESLDQINHGLIYIHPLLTGNLVNSYKEITRQTDLVREPDDEYSCTEREKQVLQLLSEGQSNQEIAKKLEISDKTVKSHISNIFKKLKVQDRTQAVLKAIKGDLVSID